MEVRGHSSALTFSVASSQLSLQYLTRQGSETGTWPVTADLLLEPSPLYTTFNLQYNGISIILKVLYPFCGELVNISFAKGRVNGTFVKKKKAAIVVSQWLRMYIWSSLLSKEAFFFFSVMDISNVQLVWLDIAVTLLVLTFAAREAQEVPQIMQRSNKFSENEGLVQKHLYAANYKCFPFINTIMMTALFLLYGWELL